MNKKKKIVSRKTERSRRKSKGDVGTGALYTVVIILLVATAAFTLIGGQIPSINSVTSGTPVVITPPVVKNAKNNLQLYTFSGATITPTTTAPIQMPTLCNKGGANDEKEILVGYQPAQGQTVSAGGQIKVWVNDEGAPIIAPGEQINSSTGQIIPPGGIRTAKAGDGYLWEPALYIAPQTAETGGTPYFPSFIKGDYNNVPTKGSGLKTTIPIDPPPAGSKMPEHFTAEDIWDVNSLGLAIGTHTAEFVIHDGDDNRGVGCVTIVIQ